MYVIYIILFMLFLARILLGIAVLITVLYPDVLYICINYPMSYTSVLLIIDYPVFIVTLCLIHLY